MLENLFGGKQIEKVLFSIFIRNECYGAQLSQIFGSAISPFQKALDRLERGGILVSFLKGRTRFYQFNPRYPFLKELRALIEKAYQFLPEDVIDAYYEPVIRKRPRRRGKP